MRLAADMSALHDVILIKNQDLNELTQLNDRVQNKNSLDN